MKLVFMLEERSMKEFLDGLLPRLLPGVEYRCIPHDGKSDLERSLRTKLRAWNDPDARFIVVRDQDSGDCKLIKAELQALCASAGRADALIRIACRELESWFFGAPTTVEAEFSVGGLVSARRRARFRNPDLIHQPSRELKQLVPHYQKIAGARQLGRVIDPDHNDSRSFQVFVAGVRRIAEQSLDEGTLPS